MGNGVNNKLVASLIAQVKSCRFPGVWPWGWAGCGVPYNRANRVESFQD